MKHIGFKRLFKGSEILEANRNFQRACTELRAKYPTEMRIHESVDVLEPYFRLNVGFFLPNDKYLLSMTEAESIFVSPTRTYAEAFAHLEATVRKFNSKTSLSEAFLRHGDGPTVLN